MAEDIKTLHDEIVRTVKDQKEYLDRQLAEIKINGVAAPETKEALERVTARLDDLEAKWNAPDSDAQAEENSIGQRFVESDEFKEFQKRGWHKGGASLRLKSIWTPEQKTTITITAVGRATTGVIPIQRLPVGIVPGAERAHRIRDVIPSRPTTAGVVDFVRENVWTSAASPQTEGSDKAESALTFTAVSSIVRTIAHWIPATRQVLDDMDGLRNFIDRKLLYGLRQKEETELLNGDNLGEHLNGICTQATAYAGTYAAAGDTKLDKLRHAALEVEAADYPCDFFVLNPVDAETIDLIKDQANNVGKYVVGDPIRGNFPLTLWGRRVVISNNMTSGRFLAGAGEFGAEIFDKQEAVIDISTEHSDYFIKNMVAIRAEERLALVVYRPASYRYGSF